MAEKHHTLAFILRAVPYGERDIIATLLTANDGRISAIAKNAKSSRRFAGGLQPLRKAQVILSKKPNSDMQLLLEMKVERGYPNIEKSYDKITIASYATELLRELAREDRESARLMTLLDAFYTDLDLAEDDPPILEALLRYFELRLLADFGASPSLYSCHRCGTSHEEIERLQCLRSGEGLLCGACRLPGEATGTLSENTLSLLHHFDQLTLPIPEILTQDKTATKQARRILQTSFENILEKDLKSKSMLEAILA